MAVTLTMAMTKSSCADGRSQFYFLLSLIVAVSTCHLPLAYGAEWEFTPRFSVAEIYSDNINHARSGRKMSGYVTRFTPALSAKGTGRHFDFNLKYRAQAYVFARKLGRSKVYNQMQANAETELYEDWFFVDARSRVGQRNTSLRGRLSVGNLALTRNRSNIISFRVSPYLKHNFADYVNATLRYSFGVRHITRGRRGAFGSNRGAFDATSRGIRFNTTSGDRLDRLFWRGSYRRRNINRSGNRVRFINGNRVTGFDVRFERAKALAGYRLTDEFSLLTEGGYSNNHFQGRRRRNIRNGFYWAAGLGWQPNRYFSAEALYGPRFRRVTVAFSPRKRLSMKFTWRNRNVGLNPGNVFRGTLRYRRRFSQWAVRYSVGTVTLYQILSQQSVFEEDLTGNPVLGPGGELISNIGVLPLNGGVFVRKRFQLSQTYSKGNTTLQFRFFKGNRKYLQTLRKVGRLGGRLTWNWQFARQLSFNLRFLAQNYTFSKNNFTFSGNNRSRFLWMVQASLVRNLGRHLQGAISFRHSEANSSQIGLSQNKNGFKANQVTAQVSYVF